MKSFQKIYFVIISTVLCFTFAACSDDEKESPIDPTTHDPNLIGKWYSYEVYSFGEEEITIIFKRDGKYEKTSEGVEEGMSFLDKTEGIWETDNEQLLRTIWYKGEERVEHVYMYDCKGDYLFLGNYEFTRIK